MKMLFVAAFGFLFVSFVVADNLVPQQNNPIPSPMPGHQQQINQFPMMSSISPFGGLSSSIGQINPSMTGGGNPSGLVAQNLALTSGQRPASQPIADSILPSEKVQKLEQASTSASEAEKPLLQKAVELFRSKPRIQAFTSFAEEVEKSKLTQNQKQDLYKRVSSMTSI